MTAERCKHSNTAAIYVRAMPIRWQFQLNKQPMMNLQASILLILVSLLQVVDAWYYYYYYYYTARTALPATSSIPIIIGVISCCCVLTIVLLVVFHTHARSRLGPPHMLQPWQKRQPDIRCYFRLNFTVFLLDLK